jgi:transcriptional regulator with XRE-family HTH domain
MRPEFRRLRIKQIDRALEPFAAVKDSPRPQKGWLRAVREATGITVRQMAMRLKKAPTLVAKLERSEAEYRITLGSLRAAADALGCRLVYAIVPRTGSIQWGKSGGKSREIGDRRNVPHFSMNRWRPKWGQSRLSPDSPDSRPERVGAGEHSACKGLGDRKPHCCS